MRVGAGAGWGGVGWGGEVALNPIPPHGSLRKGGWRVGALAVPLTLRPLPPPS